MQPIQHKWILFAMFIYLRVMRTVCCYVRPLELVNSEEPMRA